MKVEILTDHYPHVEKGLVSRDMLLAIYKCSVRILIFKASILKRDYYLKKGGLVTSLMLLQNVHLLKSEIQDGHHHWTFLKIFLFDNMN